MGKGRSRGWETRKSWWPGPGHGGERKLCTCSSLTTDMNCLVSGLLRPPGGTPWV